MLKCALTIAVLLLSTVQSTLVLLAETSHEQLRVDAVKKNMAGVSSRFDAYLTELSKFAVSQHQKHTPEYQKMSMDLLQQQRDNVKEIFHPDQHVQAVLLDMRERGHSNTPHHHDAVDHARLLDVVDTIAEAQHHHVNYLAHNKKWQTEFGASSILQTSETKTGKHRLRTNTGKGIGKHLTALKRAGVKAVKMLGGAMLIALNAFWAMLKTIVSMPPIIWIKVTETRLERNLLVDLLYLFFVAGPTCPILFKKYVCWHWFLGDDTDQGFRTRPNVGALF